MLRAEDLRDKPCGSCGDLDPKCEGMVIAGRCHPRAGTRVLYKKDTHSLHITCAKCDALVVDLSLGAFSS